MPADIWAPCPACSVQALALDHTRKHLVSDLAWTKVG